MSIIAPIDFKGERTIPQLEQKPVRDNVQWFIDKYEPIFLRELLGATLYSEFIAGLAEDPIGPKWIALRDEMDLKIMLVDYVYFWFQNNSITLTSGTGENKTKSDNAIGASPYAKMVTSWNEMVDKVRLFDLSTDVYPSFERIYWRSWYIGCHWHLPEIFRYKNQLGL